MQPIERSRRSLQALRDEIDSLNLELLRLLEARGRTVQAIMFLKQMLNEPAHDPQREEQMLAQLAARTSGPYTPAQVARVFRSIIDASRELGGAQEKQP